MHKTPVIRLIKGLGMPGDIDQVDLVTSSLCFRAYQFGAAIGLPGLGCRTAGRRGSKSPRLDAEGRCEAW